MLLEVQHRINLSFSHAWPMLFTHWLHARGEQFGPSTWTALQVCFKFLDASDVSVNCRPFQIRALLLSHEALLFNVRVMICAPRRVLRVHPGTCACPASRATSRCSCTASTPTTPMAARWHTYCQSATGRRYIKVQNIRAQNWQLCSTHNLLNGSGITPTRVLEYSSTPNFGANGLPTCTHWQIEICCPSLSILSIEPECTAVSKISFVSSINILRLV